VGILCVLSAVDRGQLRLRVLPRDAAAQASEDADALIAIGPKLLAVRRDETPHVGRLGKEREPDRHDADDRARAIVQREAAPDKVGARGERTPPEAMRQHDRASARQIAGLEGPANGGLHAKHREELDARGNREHDLRIARARQNLIAGRPCGGRKPIEAGAVPAPRLEILERRKDLREAAVLDVAVPDGDEPVDVRIGQRLDQHRLDHAENSGHRANRDGERDYGDGGDAGCPAPAAHAEAQIASDVPQPRKPVGVVRPIPRGGEVAESVARHARRFLGRHPAPDVLAGQRLEVETRLLVERFIDLGVEQRAAETPKPSHAHTLDV